MDKHETTIYLKRAPKNIIALHFGEKVIWQYRDSAGNLHWFGQLTGEHCILQSQPVINTTVTYKPNSME